MAQVIARAIVRPLPGPAELLRLVIVTGCALALILAGPFLPSVL